MTTTYGFKQWYITNVSKKSGFAMLACWERQALIKQLDRMEFIKYTLTSFRSVIRLLMLTEIRDNGVNYIGLELNLHK